MPRFVAGTMNRGVERLGEIDGNSEREYRSASHYGNRNHHMSIGAAGVGHECDYHCQVVS